MDVKNVVNDILQAKPQRNAMQYESICGICWM